MLASDVNNPDFMGSKNPDDQLFVEFYMYEPIDWNKTQELGRNVKLPAIPYVRIQVPGDKTSMIETPVREDHKRRWPQKYLYFQMQEGIADGGMKVPGWPLEEWEEIDKDRLRDLKFMRFSVVEQIAEASDAQIQRIGMGGIGLRESAKKALKDRRDKEVRAAIEVKEKEMTEMRLRLEQEKAEKDRELQDVRNQMAELRQMITSGIGRPDPQSSHIGDAVDAEAPAKPRGRPKGSKNKPKELAIESNGTNS